MTYSPRIAFGLCAMSVAMKARTGQLRYPDRVALLESALQHVCDDTEARKAALAFSSACDLYPEGAGEALLQFLDGWADDIQPRRVEDVLSQIDADAHAQFDWQKRADLQ